MDRVIDPGNVVTQLATLTSNNTPLGSSVSHFICLVLSLLRLVHLLKAFQWQIQLAEYLV